MDLNQVLQDKADAIASSQPTAAPAANTGLDSLNIPQETTTTVPQTQAPVVDQTTNASSLVEVEVQKADRPTEAKLIETTDSVTGLPVLVDELSGAVPNHKIVDQAYSDEIRHGDYIPQEGVVIDGKALPKEKINQELDPLMRGVLAANQTAEKAKANLEARAATEVNGTAPSILNTSDEDGDRIDSLLASLEDEKKKEEVGIEEGDDIQTMLDKLEAEKTFVNYNENEVEAGPNAFQVITNEEYVDDLTEVLDANNIKIVRKSGSERNATLDRFANTGTGVSVVLPNSGIFVTVSGAGSGELVAMSNLKGQTPALAELNKLDHVAQHITNSTVGRISLKQLVKIISNVDKDTLYYALYAATYPEVSELNRTCPKCGGEYYMKVKTRDLLINPKEFEGKANLVRNDVTKFTDLVATSELGKTKFKRHSNGMIVYFRHPSIDQYILSLNAISPKVMAKYEHLLDVIYNIDKIAIPTGNGTYIEYSKPDDIIMILSKLKSATDRYEIMDMIDEIRPAAIPMYGFQECNCPHCGSKNDKMPFIMEQLLFFQAAKEEELAGYKWMAKNEKKRKEKEAKNSKN